MSKFIDTLVRITRLPEKIYRGHGEYQVTQNVGVAPDGTLRAMKPKPTPGDSAEWGN